jgi:hypothetical protein
MLPGGHTPELVVIYEGPPVSPEEGTIGTEISIAGSGFGAKKGKTSLLGGLNICYLCYVFQDPENLRFEDRIEAFPYYF